MPDSVALGKLLTEQPNPSTEGIDALDTVSALHLISGEDSKVVPAVRAEIPNIARAVEAVVQALRQGGRLFYIGAGTSGRLGVLDASECPPTFNAPPGMVQGIIAGGEAALSRASEASEDDPGAGRHDLLARGFCSKDVLLGIAASGRTPYVLGAVEAARQLAAVTIGLSFTPESALARAVDIAITPLTGPEIIAGSTRMKAGTATKLVLNMISTVAMIRLGFVYGNLMVNVQPKSVKLRDRARRIVARALSLDPAAAAALLDRAGGNVRAAIVMGRLGLDLPAAEERLKQAGGRVSEALRHG